MHTYALCGYTRQPAQWDISQAATIATNHTQGVNSIGFKYIKWAINKICSAHISWVLKVREHKYCDKPNNNSTNGDKMENMMTADYPVDVLHPYISRIHHNYK